MVRLPRVLGAIMSIRPIKRVLQAKPTIEGAGVRLRRAFGFGDTKEFDPFLLFDDFRNENPEDYLAGFPWHPHRGIETITYVLAGTVNHGDSLGNKGALGAGDVQWMTAGSGILHQEMPQGDPQGRMHGFQLWANLPSSLKMTRPRYQDISGGDIPEVTDDDGTRVRVICGSFWGKAGPVEGVAADPRYLDVWVPPGKRKSLPVETSGHAFAYVFEGGGTFRDASEPGAARARQADFECPFCGRAFPELKTVLHDLGRRVRFVFRHFPVIEAHPHAESAAEVAEAAGAQGKFWEMHDLLFRRQAALDDDNLLAYVRELGLDAVRVERELERQVHRARVLEDIQSGLQSGVSGTPMFFINGRRHEEPGDARTLRAALLRAT